MSMKGTMMSFEDKHATEFMKKIKPVKDGYE